MMSLLTRRHAEAKRLLELYRAYKDSDDDWRRRKAHVDLDRFLMENRETAIMCIEQVLATEIDKLIEEQRKHPLVKRVLRPPWYQRVAYKLRRRSEDKIVNQEDASV